LIETKLIIMMSKIAIDTNILIYLYDESDETKRSISESLILDIPVIGSQVISEFLNVTKRLLKLPKHELMEKAAKLFSGCEIHPMNQITIIKAKELIVKYDFQLFDSLIVASALQANCTILYSEDLQHNLLVEKRLRIVNPFI
jgi:predicted nucleic acid-binding protein